MERFGGPGLVGRGFRTIVGPGLEPGASDGGMSELSGLVANNVIDGGLLRFLEYPKARGPWERKTGK